MGEGENPGQETRSRSPLDHCGIEVGTVHATGQDEVDTKLCVVEIVDQDERRLRDGVDVEAKVGIDGDLRVMCEMVGDEVEDAITLLRNDGCTEAGKALLKQGVELIEEGLGETDAPHGAVGYLARSDCKKASELARASSME